MKKMKRIFATLILICVFALFAVPVSAEASETVVDEAGVLTRSERSSLAASAESFRRRYNADCVFLIIGSYRYEGVSIETFADYWYDTNGCGVGPDRSGILLLLAVDDRECYISTCGSVLDEVSDYEIELILDDVTYYFADDDWYGGLSAFPGSAGRMIESVMESDGGGTNFGAKMLAVFLFPALIAFAAVSVMAYMMNNARGRSTAADYAVRDSFRLTGALDIFLSRHVAKTPRQTESGGGGHGGSSHISSSGVSHGGGGRSF